MRTLVLGLLVLAGLCDPDAHLTRELDSWQVWIWLHGQRPRGAFDAGALMRIESGTMLLRTSRDSISRRVKMFFAHWAQLYRESTRGRADGEATTAIDVLNFLCRSKESEERRRFVLAGFAAAVGDTGLVKQSGEKSGADGGQTPSTTLTSQVAPTETQQAEMSRANARIGVLHHSACHASRETTLYLRSALRTFSDAPQIKLPTRKHTMAFGEIESVNSGSEYWRPTDAVMSPHRPLLLLARKMFHPQESFSSWSTSRYAAALADQRRRAAPHADIRLEKHSHDMGVRHRWPSCGTSAARA